MLGAHSATPLRVHRRGCGPSVNLAEKRGHFPLTPALLTNPGTSNIQCSSPLSPPPHPGLLLHFAEEKEKAARSVVQGRNARVWSTRVLLFHGRKFWRWFFWFIAAAEQHVGSPF